MLASYVSFEKSANDNVFCLVDTDDRGERGYRGEPGGGRGGGGRGGGRGGRGGGGGRREEEELPSDAAVFVNYFTLDLDPNCITKYGIDFVVHILFKDKIFLENFTFVFCFNIL